jgi:hypothetical protein
MKAYKRLSTARRAAPLGSTIIEVENYDPSNGGFSTLYIVGEIHGETRIRTISTTEHGRVLGEVKVGRIVGHLGAALRALKNLLIEKHGQDKVEAAINKNRQRYGSINH